MPPPPLEHILVGVALVLLTSILASKAAVRTGIPALLLFLAIGMLLGAEGPGRLRFEDPWLTQAVGVVALAFILFSGGLDTRIESVRPVLREGLLLSVLGVLITALAVGAFAHYVMGFTWETGILLGAIMASTDAAAVFGVLRGQGLALRGRVGPLLELESGSNDPMAVFLTLGMIQLITLPDMAPIALVPLFILQMLVGGVVGVVMGEAARVAINRLRLEYDGLYPVLTVSLVLLTYGAAASLGGSGFLAVYLAGLSMERERFIHHNSLLNFHDGLAWLMQITMFLALGLSVMPSSLVEVAPVGIEVALFLIFVARPLSVLVSTLPTTLSWRERLFVSWVGLRGAAPIVLATFPLLAGVETPVALFDLVFFVVLTSVLLQGTLIGRVARWLRVDDPAADASRTSMLASIVQGSRLNDNLMEIDLPPDAAVLGKQLVDLHLPLSARLVLICRPDPEADRVIVPTGSTILRPGDQVLLLAHPSEHESLRQALTQSAPDVESSDTDH